MTAEERAELRRELAKSREAQGLPPTVEDPVALRKVATLVASAMNAPAGKNDDTGTDTEAADEAQPPGKAKAS